MNFFTLLSVLTCIGFVTAAMLDKIRNTTQFRDSVSLFLIATIIYYVATPLLLMPVAIPIMLISRCIATLCLLITIKRFILSLLNE